MAELLQNADFRRLVSSNPLSTGETDFANLVNWTETIGKIVRGPIAPPAVEFFAPFMTQDFVPQDDETQAAYAVHNINSALGNQTGRDRLPISVDPVFGRVQGYSVAGILLEYQPVFSSPVEVNGSRGIGRGEWKETHYDSWFSRGYWQDPYDDVRQVGRAIRNIGILLDEQTEPEAEEMSAYDRTAAIDLAGSGAFDVSSYPLLASAGPLGPKTSEGLNDLWKTYIQAFDAITAPVSLETGYSWEADGLFVYHPALIASYPFEQWAEMAKRTPNQRWAIADHPLSDLVTRTRHDRTVNHVASIGAFPFNKGTAPLTVHLHAGGQNIAIIENYPIVDRFDHSKSPCVWFEDIEPMTVRQLTEYMYQVTHTGITEALMAVAGEAQRTSDAFITETLDIYGIPPNGKKAYELSAVASALYSTWPASLAMMARRFVYDPGNTFVLRNQFGLQGT